MKTRTSWTEGLRPTACQPGTSLYSSATGEIKIRLIKTLLDFAVTKKMLLYCCSL